MATRNLVMIEDTEDDPRQQKLQRPSSDDIISILKEFGCLDELEAVWENQEWFNVMFQGLAPYLPDPSHAPTQYRDFREEIQNQEQRLARG